MPVPPRAQPAPQPYAPPEPPPPEPPGPEAQQAFRHRPRSGGKPPSGDIVLSSFQADVYHAGPCSSLAYDVRGRRTFRHSRNCVREGHSD
eukprot:11150152-Alexandrium_andersonii.AAC.1